MLAFLDWGAGFGLGLLLAVVASDFVADHAILAIGLVLFLVCEFASRGYRRRRCQR